MNGREFLGRGLKFPLQVDARTGKLAMVSEEEDIAESIGIILRTSQGERVMRPGFGSTVMEYAFSAVSGVSMERIAYEVRRQLVDQEPRITDVEVVCRQLDQQDGSVVVEISYTVDQTNNRYNRVYPFYITEGSRGGGSE